MKAHLLEYISTWAPPVLIMVIGTLIGWLFKRFIYQRLKSIADRTSWKGDDVIFGAIRAHIVLWFFMASFYIAAQSVKIASPYNEYLGHIILAILIMSVTLAASKISVGLLDYWARKEGTNLPSTTIFVNLARIIIISIGVLVILQSLKISITPFLTALGVGGLAVSLALKDTLSDFFAGLHILLSQKVKPGDFIELDSGERGYVQNITWRHTTLMERTNNIITIPNAKLSAATVKNYDRGDPSFSVRVPLGIAYDSDLEHVKLVTKEVALDVVRNVKGAKKDEPPIVRFFEFGDSSINLKVYFRGEHYGDQHSIIDDFIKRIHQRYAQEGIEIPFPIRTLIHRNTEK